MDYFVTNNSLAPAPMGIQSTAGAVPVKNDKGEVSMKKVKVHRYVSGKRPDYAPAASSEEESEEDDFIDKCAHKSYEESESGSNQVVPSHALPREHEEDDPRLRRLTRLERQRERESEASPERHRQIHEPEILETEPERARERIKLDSSDSSEDEELSDTEIERRRVALKQRLLSNKEVDEELTQNIDEDKSGESSDESSEYEEYTDSEEETGPRLKPVFVRKRDRITVMEKEKEAIKQKQAEAEAKKLSDERKRQTLRMVEEVIRKETQLPKSTDQECKLDDVCTDDENDEVEYEAWKLRELKRIKRDREERETIEKERLEIERIRNMTEEERRQEARLNPKTITNKAAKGKYKFLQKYYHRGAFYLDRDDTIFKRDFSGATLEDHFDKTVLPKVMQVKNFGRSGRTKYTHLVDQDTTQFDSPWISETAQNLKFHNNQAAGMKQYFDRPSLKKLKTTN
ncbi:microfibrillar-associated protein 1-like [Venturia canescens]|uniref:microfibrillar-associated protein 1-like n=1 Tax=Venturia canescens TaxID=32260 RepID=UPI001C9D209C|nr:microfibrillar-associated protein 1-like [Venturia canescens]